MYNKKNLILLLFGSVFTPLWWVLFNYTDEFDPLFMIYSHAISGLAVIIQISIATIGLKIIERWNLPSMRWIFVGFILFVVAANIFCMALSSITLRYRYTALISIGLSIASITLFRFPKGRQFLAVFAAAVITIPIANNIFPKNNHSSESSLILNATYLPDVSALSAAKKNLYIVVFDSLLSTKAYREIYNQNQTPWSMQLKNKGFKVVENASSPGRSTAESFGTLLNFGGHFRGSAKGNITGSPVYRYFKSGGYKIAHITSYMNLFSEDGELALQRDVAPVSNYCTLTPRFFLYGVCNFFGDDSSKFIRHDIGEALQALNLHISKINPDEKWLTIIYLWYPGHSPLENEYRFSDPELVKEWSLKFISNSESSGPFIDTAIDQILDGDPNSVVTVFGDHGSYKYRGVPDTGNAQITAKAVELDKYGVTFAIYPKKACEIFLIDEYQIKKLFLDLLRCNALN